MVQARHRTARRPEPLQRYGAAGVRKAVRSAWPSALRALGRPNRLVAARRCRTHHQDFLPLGRHCRSAPDPGRGISGIASRMLPPYRDGALPSRLGFVAGLVAAPLLVLLLTGQPVQQSVSTNIPLMAFAGRRFLSWPALTAIKSAAAGAMAFVPAMAIGMTAARLLAASGTARRESEMLRWQHAGWPEQTSSIPILIDYLRRSRFGRWPCREEPER